MQTLRLALFTTSEDLYAHVVCKNTTVVFLLRKTCGQKDNWVFSKLSTILPGYSLLWFHNREKCQNTCMQNKKGCLWRREAVFGVGGENAVWVDGDICLDASE